MAEVLNCKSTLFGQTDSTDGEIRSFRVMFYNTENLFDIVDDTITDDEDFTPAGNLHWTYKRYLTKLRNTYKVIVAVGAWQPPDVVGLCEIENRKVLNDLIHQTPLARYPYRLVHEESPDRRGIDAALLYNAETVRFIMSKNYRIRKSGLLTRDILYFKALLGTDTCHFLVNHWPSRSQGQLNSERNRFTTAGLLKHITDSLFMHSASAKIVIMGDFNDEPSDESLTEYLKTEADLNKSTGNSLYNVTVVPASGAVKGTLKYQGKWSVFDQMIVSGNLIKTKKGLTAGEDLCRVFMKPYLLTEDKVYEGYKPYRTYNGFNYQGGFSDHLPVYMDLIFR
jgi:predicted extracellular nuclease